MMLKRGKKERLPLVMEKGRGRTALWGGGWKAEWKKKKEEGKKDVEDLTAAEQPTNSSPHSRHSFIYFYIAEAKK